MARPPGVSSALSVAKSTWLSSASAHAGSGVSAAMGTASGRASGGSAVGATTASAFGRPQQPAAAPGPRPVSDRTMRRADERNGADQPRAVVGRPVLLGAAANELHGGLLTPGRR